MFLKHPNLFQIKEAFSNTKLIFHPIALLYHDTREVWSTLARRYGSG